MYISLNELRQRVTILRPVTVEDGAGNLIRQGEEGYSSALSTAHELNRRKIIGC